MLDALRARIETLRTMGARATPRAAQRLLESVRQAATTTRGTIPEFTASATEESVTIAGPAWAMRRATDALNGAGSILAEELRRVAEE